MKKLRSGTGASYSSRLGAEVPVSGHASPFPLFRSCICQRRRGLRSATVSAFAGLCCGIGTAGLATRAVGSATTTRLTLRGTFRFAFLYGGGNFGGDLLDHRLRARAGNFDRSLLLRLRLMLWLRNGNRFVHTVDVVTEIIAIIPVVPLEAFLHLRLGGSDDPVVVFSVLQVILGHDPIAGALGIACESGILLCDVLGRTANLHVGTRAVVGPSQRVGALAVEVVSSSATAATAVVTPPTTLVLLSWPHR